MVPGNGGGGVVARVGAGMSADLLGTRVVASLTGSGGYVERAIAAVEAAPPVPDGAALDEAAATGRRADGRAPAGRGEGPAEGIGCCSRAFRLERRTDITRPRTTPPTRGR